MIGKSRLEQHFETLKEFFDGFPEEKRAEIVCDKTFVNLDSFYNRELNNLMKNADYEGNDLPDYVKEVQKRYEALVDSIDKLREGIYDEKRKKKIKEKRDAKFKFSTEVRDRFVHLPDELRRNSFEAQVYRDFVSGDY